MNTFLGKSRLKTNFHAVQEVEKIWLTDTSIERGSIDGDMVKRISEILELEIRDRMSLQDLRDFAVMYLTTRKKEKEQNEYSEEDNKRWDCMSAITGVIDRLLM